MNQLTESIVTIFVGITTVAIIAVIVSKNSDSANVISSLFKGYGGAISAAVGPVTGSSLGGLSSGNFNIPNVSF